MDFDEVGDHPADVAVETDGLDAGREEGGAWLAGGQGCVAAGVLSTSSRLRRVTEFISLS